jgi:hypothetical protein
MDASTLRTWFDGYLEMFAACVRREVVLAELLGYYGVPLTITTDEGVVALTTDDQVAAVIQGQVDGLHAQGYHRTALVSFEVSVLNSSSAVCHTALSRLDGGGAEISRPTITYLLTQIPSPLRISVIAAHGSL